MDGDEVAALHPAEERDVEVRAEWKTALNLADGERLRISSI